MTRSLRARLLLALLVPLSAGVAIGAYLDHRNTTALVTNAHDRALAGIAAGLAARLETDRDNDLPAHLMALVQTLGRLNASDRLRYLVRDGQGHDISGDAALAGLLARPVARNPDFLDDALGGQPVRAVVYAYTGPDGQARIVVAETLRQREVEVRQAIVWSALTNAGVALGMALGAVLAVGLALRPLRALSASMHGHDVTDLRPVQLRSVPQEIDPLILALNRLIRRLRRAVHNRHAFINNTAHQLRTPLAGLNSQVELLLQEPLPAPAAGRAGDLANALQRMTRLVNQLLSLARADEDIAHDQPMMPLDLRDVLQATATACLDAALARDIDLGFDLAPAQVNGSAWMLRELTSNLVGNAIAHCPPGAVVTVRCGLQPAPGGGPRPCIEVEDNGPGIANADRQRVFSRFVRLPGRDSPGSGLGLAIVREIAQHHHAEVSLHDGANGRGLLVRVLFA